MVARLWSGTATLPGELAAADAAMQRMSWIYPVRDGVSSLDGQPDAGLRYDLYDNPMGPPNQDGHLYPLFAQWSNRPAGDSIDTAISYRFPNAGDPGSGGNSGHQCPGQSVLYSIIVWAPRWPTSSARRPPMRSGSKHHKALTLTRVSISTIPATWLALT